jgi:hypothetical protein
MSARYRPSADPRARPGLDAIGRPRAIRTTDEAHGLVDGAGRADSRGGRNEMVKNGGEDESIVGCTWQSGSHDEIRMVVAGGRTRRE